MYRSLINHKKIKYSILKELIAEYMVGVKEVNCFLSLDMILKTFYSIKPDEVSESLASANPNALSSEIINVVAHYRHYFWSRYHVPSNYFIYYSFDMADYCCEHCLTYKESYYNKRMGNTEIQEYKIINENIEFNLNLIKLITEYLPNIYFINTGSLEPAVLPQLLISKNKPKETIHNFVFTTNKNEYQMVNNPYTTVISVNGDDSKVYTSHNLMYSLVKGTKDADARKEIIRKVSSKFYIPTLAISGYKSYDIKGCKGYGTVKVLKLISKLLKENKISDIDYTTLDDILQYFPNSDIQLINNNYYVLNLKNLVQNISNKEYINIKKQINNKSDNMSLMEINSKYYESNPLMLIELMEGEE